MKEWIRKTINISIAIYKDGLTEIDDSTSQKKVQRQGGDIVSNEDQIIGTKVFTDIFKNSNVQYKIPFFQRGYVWGKDPQKQLFNDIKDHLAIIDTNDDLDIEERLKTVRDSKYFFGPVVVKKIHTHNEDVQFLIIDGQQRLTTVYILLAIITRLLGKRDSVDNPNVQNYINELNRYKQNSSSNGSDFNKLKILSSKGDAYATYKAIFGSSSKPQVNDTEKYMLDMYDNSNNITEMERYWSGFLKKFNSDELYIWANLLLYTFQVVWITLHENQDEQTIFESLNDKGTALTGGELICNYLFTPIKKEQEMLHYEKWLKPQFAIEDRRAQPGNKVSDAKYSQFEAYLRCLFSIGKDKMLPIGSDYRLTYYTFKDKHKKIGEKEAREWLEKISSHAGIFCDIIDPNANGLQNEFIKPFIESIKRLLDTQTNSVIVFLLSLFIEHKHDKISKEDVHQILQITYSLIVRGKITGKNFKYDTIFPSLTSELEKHNDKKSAFRDLIKGKKLFIADDDFKRALQKRSLYGSSKSGLSWCRFILKEIDRYMAQQNNHGEEIAYDTLNTVEHVFPQTPNEEWERLDTNDPNTRDIIHSIGNLFLISSPKNCKAGRNPFSDKLEIYKGNKTELYSDLVENAPDKWGIEQIQERSDRLAKYAAGLWKY